MADLRHLPHRLAFQLAGRLAVRRMNPQDQLQQLVRDAIARALQGQTERDEEFWQESIESMRGRMARDDTLLTYVDYGSTDEGDASVTRKMSEVQAYSLPAHQGLALHVLVRDLQPEICLELGTCLGVSTAYIASALDLNECGSLTTLEGGKDLSRVASINFSRLGLRNTRFVTGRFADTLPAVLAEAAPIDFAYIDGHHDGEAVRTYFETILHHVSPQSVIVLDDIRWSRDMRDAWRSMCEHPRVAACIDLLSFGICLTGPPANGRENLLHDA